MKYLSIILLLSLLSCEKEDYYIPEQVVYPTASISIINIETSPVYSELHIRVVYHAIDRHGNTIWASYREQPNIIYKSNKATFNIELKHPRTALIFKPGTCPGTIKGFDIKINDSILNIKGDYGYYRLEIK
jgi:hypothetical protein